MKLEGAADLVDFELAAALELLAEVLHLHCETLVIYKLGSRNFTRQNDLHE